MGWWVIISLHSQGKGCWLPSSNNIFEPILRRWLIPFIDKLVVTCHLRQIFIFVSINAKKKKNFTIKFHRLSGSWDVSKEGICIKRMRVSLIIAHKVGYNLSTFEVTFTCIFKVVIWYLKTLCIIMLLKSLVIVSTTSIEKSVLMLWVCGGISLMTTH